MRLSWAYERPRAALISLTLESVALGFVVERLRRWSSSLETRHLKTDASGLSQCNELRRATYQYSEIATIHTLGLRTA
jgi:hypothetical protein